MDPMAFSKANDRPRRRGWIETALTDKQRKMLVDGWTAGLSGSILRRWLTDDQGIPADEMITVGGLTRWLQEHYPRGRK